MKLVSMNEILRKAQEGKYAIAQININNLEWTKAILLTAKETNSPVILGVSEGAAKYMGGYVTVSNMVNGLMQDLEITTPVVLHLDHGQSFESCKAALDSGFTSVMIDGSHHPIDENITMTKQVVDYAHNIGASVEAEVGTVGGEEDGVVGGIQYADPQECLRMVKEANIDALAAALGSVHGEYDGEPKLGFDEMQEISDLTGIPLVLHGGSGIPKEQIKKAIARGHNKINVNTECQQAFTKATRKYCEDPNNSYDPRKVLAPGVEAIKDVVKGKFEEFGSLGKA